MHGQTVSLGDSSEIEHRKEMRNHEGKGNQRDSRFGPRVERRKMLARQNAVKGPGFVFAFEVVHRNSEGELPVLPGR